MPIECPIKQVPITRDEYLKLNHEIMGILFSIHNDLGRLHDESIYRHVMARRLRDRGHSVEMEVPIRVSHGTFEKTYYMDIVVDRRIVYEIKSAEALHGRDDVQLINYLMLSGFWWGRLVNFGGVSVIGRYLRATVTDADRYDFTVDAEDWTEIDQSSRWLKDNILELAGDWGMFLDAGLFYEALCGFRGGTDEVYRAVEIKEGGCTVGREKMSLLNPHTAFEITAIKDRPGAYRTHLLRKISHTRLWGIHWANFNKRRLTLKTVQNPNGDRQEDCTS